MSKSSLRVIVTSIALALLLAGVARDPAPAHGAPLEQPSGWPSSFTLLDTDSNDCGGNMQDHRDVLEARSAVQDGYLFLRLSNVGPAGWPNTGPQGQARYKWFIDTVGGDVELQGGNIDNAEYLLQVEDLTLNGSDPTPGRDQLGEITLMDDLANGGFSSRWNSTNPPKYTNNTPSGSPSPSPDWVRALGSGTAGTGGPQSAMTDPDIGYRVTGVHLDMYVSLSALGDPNAIEVMWATDSHSNNLDSGPNCDRSDNATEGIPIPGGSGSLTIEKQAVPNGDTADFDFFVSGPLTDETFTLSDNESTTLDNLAAGSYTITETLPAGWVLDNVNCQSITPDLAQSGPHADIDGVQLAPSANGNNGTSVTLEPGEDVVCTFNNRDTFGTLRVFKQVEPDDPTQDFAFDVSGDMGSVAQFTLLDGETEELRIPAGDYTITEDVPPGWRFQFGQCDNETFSFSNPFDTTISPGGFTNCTIHNDDVRAELILRKETTPDGDPQAFDFEVEGPPPFVQLDVGTGHGCAVRSDGSVACWGGNNSGQSSPVPPGRYAQVSAGDAHTCGVKTDGSVVCWGSNGFGKSSPVPPGTYAQVSAGVDHTCGLKTDGSVVCWGLNNTGQSSPVSPGTYAQVSAGSNHTCGLKTDGSVVCWGFNASGQSSPVPPGTYAQVSAGGIHTCGLKTDGSVVCWGGNGFGESSPVPLGTYAQVSAGNAYTCGLKTDGSVVCWGRNNAGQSSPVPPGTYAQVSAATSHSCALRVDGRIACWGNNNNGRSTPPNAGPGLVASFDLADGESETLLLPANVYTATEALPAGWDLEGVVCEAGCRDGQECDFGSVNVEEIENGAVLDLPPGVSVDCTFDNEGALADLSVRIEPLKGDVRNGGGDGDDDPATLDRDETLLALQPPNTAWAGEEIVYRVEVFNSGPSTAINTRVEVELPPEILYLADTDNCSVTGVNGAGGQTLTCELGDLERFDFVEFQIKTRVAPGAVRAEPDGTIVAKVVATVTSDTPDPNLENNIDDASCFIQDLADLKITKIASPTNTVQAGEQFTYTILVDNLGPSTARNIVVTDTLVTSGFVDANGCSLAVRTEGGAIDEFDCNFALSIGVFDLATFGANWLNPRSPSDMGRIIITINLTADQALDMTNITTVTSDTPDPNTANNMAMATLSVAGTADLELEVLGEEEEGDPEFGPALPAGLFGILGVPDPVLAGEQVVSTFITTNNGPSSAVNAFIEASLPGVVRVIDVSGFRTGNVPAGCNAGTPGNPGDPAVCEFGTLAPGDSGTMVVTMLVLPDAVDDPVTDSRLIQVDTRTGSDTFDPDLSDNFEFDAITVNAEADLELTKFAIGPAVAGAGFHYELQIDNLGPSVSRDLTLRDVLPTEMRLVDAYVDLEGGVGNVPLACTVSTGSNFVFCPLGDIPPTNGAPVIVVLNVVIDADVPDGTMLTNNADVLLTDTPDPDTLNNSDDADVTVASQAELVVEKTAARLDPVAGTRLQYTVAVRNDGPSDAVNVAVEDTLPAGYNFVQDSDVCSETAPGILTCRPAGVAPTWVLPVGQTATFDVLVELDPSIEAGTDATNQACATADNALIAPPGVCATADTTAERVADLRIRKFGKPDRPVQAGELLTYTVFVDNLGPSFTGPVFVTEELVSDGAFFLTALDPEINNTAPGVPYDDTQIACDYLAQDPSTGAILFQGTVRGDGLGAIGAPIGPIPGHLTLTCRFEDPAGLPVFDPVDGTGRWTYRYVVRADDELDINNLASVTGADPDPDFSNNQADTAHAYDAVADLAITKDDLGIVQGTGCPAAAAPMPAMAGMVTAGKTIQWTVNITNTGPSTARNVKFLDRLPPWVRVTAVTAAGGAGSCSTGEAGNVLDQLRCGIGDLAAGASATAVIDAVVDPSAPEGFILENDIMVMSDTRDDNNANDFDSTLTTVKTAADLRIEKMDMPDPVKAGEALWYTLRVTNDGPSDAKFVVLTDTLPAEVTFVSAAVTKLSKVPGMCMVKAQVVTCALGTIPAGHFGEVLIRTTVNPDAVPSGLTFTTITNSAAVGSMTFDPCAANNTVAEPTTVQRLSDVFVTKTDDPDPVNAGNVVTYTVTFGNNGPSTATSVAVVDVLPAGLSFVGCAPSTPADLVTCTEGPAGTITLNEILAAGAVVWQDAPPASALNDLDPGETYSFQIVALVDSGYVLDGLGDTGAGQACEALATATGYPHFAHNAITISAAFFDMMAGVPAVQTNTHDECTRVNGLADLAIDKTDIFGDPVANPDNYFLECDPVEPGGMITYMLTITNDGPSDAAQVVVMDWLPEGFVAVDPAQVMIEIENGAGMVEEVRDTGKITLVIGNDDGLLGRLNAGNSVKVTIRVMVRQDAECGGVALNTAMVTTRALVGPPAVTSPTPDDDLANNMDTETTTIECPKVTVKKTVSYDGTCPGVDFATINQIGPGATYCYEITNSGTTYLDHIRITDTLRARTNGMPVIAFTDTIRHGLDPKVPVAPGETVRRQHTVGALNKECGRVTNEVIVTANPVNSGRTDLPCLETVTASDDALIEVPCAGVDWRLQLPTLDTEVCDSWVQVQNVGDNDTMVLLVAWGDAGFCPPQAAGPLKAECSGLLRPGSAWSFTASQIPTGAKSAVLYSLSAERVRTEAGGRLPFGRTVCEEFFFGVVGDDFAWAEFDSAYRERYPWRGLDFSTYHGEPIAASVNRSCPDPEDPNLTVNAAYTGISSDLEGARDPRSGSFAFFAPLVFAGQNGMNSQIHIQNSGTECTSLELWMKAQDNCMRPTLADVLSLAPGETVTFDPNTVVGPDWLGSAWVRSTQPLGLVVDTLAGNHFTSYNGFAADIHDYGFSVGNMISYVPLIYSEYQGWDTAIQVQNLSAITAAKVKVYFLDRSGDVITTLVDWVCPYGSQTFFLPVLSALPGNWVGSARVESQEWWAPGQPLVEPPRIASVALMEKWADPARTSRREAVAYNGSPECLLYDWQIADGTKGGLSSGSAVFAIPLIAKGNRGITSEIGITNLVPKPGFTDFAMFFYDQNGLLDHVCQKLNEKQVEYINLDSWGFVHNGFLGSMVVSAVFWEHDVFDSRGRFQRNLVGLGGVAVERIGGVLGGQDVPGDESKAFEAFPVFDHFAPEDPPNCPGVPGGFRP